MLNRQQRRQQKRKTDIEIELEIQEDGPGFIRLVFELPTQDLPTMTYTGSTAIDRWRRFCIAFSEALRGASREETQRQMYQPPNTPVLGEGATYQTKMIGAQRGRHEARLPAFGHEPIGKVTGLQASKVLQGLASTLLL